MKNISTLLFLKVCVMV